MTEYRDVVIPDQPLAHAEQIKAELSSMGIRESAIELREPREGDE